MRNIVATIIVLLSCATAPTPAAHELDGSWCFNVTTAAGSGGATLTLLVEGNVIKGKYSGQVGEADLSGTVDGDDVRSGRRLRRHAACAAGLSETAYPLRCTRARRSRRCAAQAAGVSHGLAGTTWRAQPSGSTRATDPRSSAASRPGPTARRCASRRNFVDTTSLLHWYPKREAIMNHEAMSSSAPVLLLAYLTLAAPSPASADDKGHFEHRAPSVCERTADTLFKACLFGLGDELETTLANCANISDANERSGCIEEARGSRRDEIQSCREVREARGSACELLGENRYDPDPLLDPTIAFIDPDDVPDIYPPNPYLSLAAGRTYVLGAGDEGDETDVVHVTDESREILGVSCRVVVDVEFEVEDENGVVEYEALEVTDDWFAQDEIGNVYYCGELSRNFEDGVLRDLEGSFEAGRDFAKAGELIRAFPAAGEAHRQEFALGEAEDIVQYLDLATAPSEEEGGDNARFACHPNRCLKTLEFEPSEPEATEFKYYLPGTGFVLAVDMEDGEFTGEREELLCVGDSLDVLEEDDCQIADPQALRAALCQVAPETFCD
jgi:hypothetical protein